MGLWSLKKVLEFFNFVNVSSEIEDFNLGLDYIVCYVELFEWLGKELWFVFYCEGKLLFSFLYNVGVDVEDDRDFKGFKVVQLLFWWRWFKIMEDGRLEMCSIIYQLLLVVKVCYDCNIIYWDIKFENMVVSMDRGSDWFFNLMLWIIDFGSVID